MNHSSFDWIIPIGLSAIASNVPAPPNSRSHVRRGISYSEREATISYSATSHPTGWHFSFLALSFLSLSVVDGLKGFAYALALSFTFLTFLVPTNTNEFGRESSSIRRW
uniref:Uncharacterized protein n=4 Tax=Brassiceae TaxID=981071 RepID=R4I1C8_RAPSA|nr:orf108c [Brassica carinata]YP_009228137.1 hypothetical protein AYB38_gp11 [Brassica nigra]AEX57686.1 hypothetical protein RasatMp055 [Raphanus sativus]QNC68168.1 hypothetical protein [Brassica juncea]AEH43609.1 orf108c [Brassica carinata]AGC81720.1 hypothetical protein DCGMS_00600 [Raphanus sativus]AIE42584.1 hypothetical protein RadishMT_p054 [Raphanus sativus]